MKSTGMRYFLLAPMVVLATVACAKRDNDFAARLAKAKSEAAEKTGKPLDGTAASRFTKTTPEIPTTLPLPAEAYKGDATIVRADACENPIKMEAQKDEKELALDEIGGADKSSLLLKSTEFFSEVTTKEKETETKAQLHATGSLFTLPENFKATTSTQDKVAVICQTGKEAPEDRKAEKLEAVLRLPLEVLADGSVKILREDKVEIEGRLVKTNSTLYEADQNLKKMAGDENSEGTQLLVLKQTNGDVVIKLKTTSTDAATGKTTTQWMAGTYTVKK